jgi:hypothetical protein
MNIFKRLRLIVAMALTIDAFIIAPAFPQQGEVEALNARVIALYKAEKFAEAVPLAQRQSPKKRSVPITPMSRTTLISLGLLYNQQSRYADGRTALQTSAGDPGENARSRPPQSSGNAHQLGAHKQPTKSLRRR